MIHRRGRFPADFNLMQERTARLGLPGVFERCAEVSIPWVADLVVYFWSVCLLVSLVGEEVLAIGARFDSKIARMGFEDLDEEFVRRDVFVLKDLAATT